MTHNLATEDTPSPARAGRPVTDDRVEGARLFERVYASPLAHRLLPSSAALALAAFRAKLRERRNPAELEETRHFLRELLRNTPRAAEADALAPKLMAEKSRNQELLWRGWLLEKSAVEGVEHWDAAGDGGRGFVIAFGHIGASWCIAPVLARAGLRTHIVIGPHYWNLYPGYKGLEFRYRRRELEDRIGAERVLSSETPPERLVEVIGAGEPILLAWDAPGRAATPFLGRTASVGGGPARLAFGMQLKVLPAVPERRGAHLVVRLHPPIDSRDFSDHRELRAEIARRFEPIVLERPEDLEMAWVPPPLITSPEEAASAQPG